MENKKLLVVIAVTIGIVMVSPFIIRGIAPNKVIGLTLIFHYQTLVLGLLTVVIAIVALNTYLGLNDRIRKQMQAQAHDIKEDNKRRLRLLLDIEQARQVFSAFQGIVEKICRDPDLYTFFLEDLKNVFGVLAKTNAVTPATGAYLSNFLQQHPHLDDNHYIFRGQADSTWPLVPTLSRLAARSPYFNGPETRKNHLQTFQSAAKGRRGSSPVELSDSQWWALGQHYGLVTPLLDWTYSLFVAAFFRLLLI